MSKPIHTIAIIEDDPSLRETLSDLVSTAKSLKLTGTYPSAETALEAIADSAPAVVLMDIQLPGMSGIECAARLKEKFPEIQIMMVTVYDNNDRIFDALAAGASGYLLKRDAPDKLLESLEDLMAGGSPMSSAIARKVVQNFRTPVKTKGKDLDLTPRETEILDLLVKGSLYKEIAWDLGIGVETVRTHLHNIYSKLHVRTRTEAVVKYLGH
ncbi:response regulator [Haloferula chungangensis]|uniref:Response regulator n=1 Tax=Haloferula chungangensis TaxID=1048331 RepID=A0ABW2L2R4_9BACT